MNVIGIKQKPFRQPQYSQSWAALIFPFLGTLTFAFVKFPPPLFLMHTFVGMFELPLYLMQYLSLSGSSKMLGKWSWSQAKRYQKCLLQTKYKATLYSLRML